MKTEIKIMILEEDNVICIVSDASIISVTDQAV